MEGEGRARGEPELGRQTTFFVPKTSKTLELIYALGKKVLFNLLISVSYRDRCPVQLYCYYRRTSRRGPCFNGHVEPGQGWEEGAVFSPLHYRPVPLLRPEADVRRVAYLAPLPLTPGTFSRRNNRFLPATRPTPGQHQPQAPPSSSQTRPRTTARSAPLLPLPVPTTLPNQYPITATNPPPPSSHRHLIHQLPLTPQTIPPRSPTQNSTGQFQSEQIISIEKILSLKDGKF
jgi:hypothetical protein